jgi:hypothetical protein
MHNQYVQQMDSASNFAHKVVEVLRKVNREKRTNFQIFFTGHSSGLVERKSLILLRSILR